MGLVVLGIFQYLLSQTKKNDSQRSANLDLLEKETIDNARLKGELILSQSKYTDMKQYAQKYYRLYKKYEGLYEATLDKSHKQD